MCSSDSAYMLPGAHMRTRPDCWRLLQVTQSVSIIQLIFKSFYKPHLNCNVGIQFFTKSKNAFYLLFIFSRAGFRQILALMKNAITITHLSTNAR